MKNYQFWPKFEKSSFVSGEVQEKFGRGSVEVRERFGRGSGCPGPFWSISTEEKLRY